MMIDSCGSLEIKGTHSKLGNTSPLCCDVALIWTTHLPKNPLKTVMGITSCSWDGCSIIFSCFFCAGDGPSSLKEEEDKVRVVGLILLIVLCVDKTLILIL